MYVTLVIDSHEPCPSFRAKSARRPGITWLHADVLQPGQPPVAGPEGSHQEAEVREDQREEALHSRGGALQRIPE